MCVVYKTLFSYLSISCLPTLPGEPSPAATGAAALRQTRQADSGSVPGPARAAPAGRQRQLTSGLLGDHAGDERARQKEDT